ncbi:transposase, partial [Desulfobacula sp.]|nr:transposase [Desulfobacula sp.]
MIRVNDHNQLPLFDPWEFLSPRRRKMLDQSWAGLFQKEILRSLPIGLVKPYFSRVTGRPTKELYTMLGVQLLQQAHDLTDKEAVYQLAFNIQWHYALNITEESDSAKYLSLKTLWTFRQIMSENGLETSIFN